MELDPDAGEEGGGGLEGGQVGVVGQQRRIGRNGAQHVDVAQATVALLEVRLQEERHVAHPSVPILHLRLEVGEVAGAEGLTPGRTGPGHQRVGHFRITPDQAGVQQAQGDADVIGRGGEHLGRTANRVIEVHTLVPDRVPDGIGHRFYVAVTPVEQDHIEVAVGAKRTPAVAPDGQKGQVAVGFSNGAGRHAGEPFVGLGGVGPAERLTLKVGAGQEVAATFTE